jgi:hypothetical protein
MIEGKGMAFQKKLIYLAISALIAPVAFFSLGNRRWQRNSVPYCRRSKLKLSDQFLMKKIEILAVTAFLIFFLCPSFYSISAASSYAVGSSGSAVVNEWSECRTVTNAGSNPTIFVPTNTSSEWSEFRLHYPAGISLGTCGPSMPFYAYRRKIDITSSIALASYPIKFTIDTASLVASGKMQNDCDDVRITNSDGTAIDFVVELCNTANSEIWAEIPSIANGATEIYMFYGYPSATKAGNGINTFAYYEDFDDGSLTGWTRYYNVGGNDYNWTNTNSTLTISTINQSSPDSMQIYGKGGCYNPNTFGILTIALTSINPPGGTYRLEYKQRGSGGQFSWCSGGTAAQNDVTLDGAIIYSSPLCSYTNCNTCVREWETAASGTLTFSGVARSLRFRTRATDCEVSYGWVDNIKLRKYSSPEPVASVGPEELI